MYRQYNIRINKFTYLGYMTSYQGEVDICNKTAKYTKTMELVKNVLKPSLVQRYPQLHLYRTLTKPILSYGSEAWKVSKQDIAELQLAK
jgi:hypothetical protein